jgi:hypothetical protein
MNTSQSLRGLVKTVAVVLCVGLISIGAAFAHGGDTSRIHACVNKSSGRVRIVGAEETCRPSERPLDWNIVGPQGPPGPAFRTYAVFETVQIPGAQTRILVARCHPGDIATGGGFGSNSGRIKVTTSAPVLTQPPSAWVVTAHNELTSLSITLVAYVMCADQ